MSMWKPLARLADGIQENDKLEFVWSDQTHHPSMCVGKRGLTQYGYNVQEERGD